MAAVVGQLPYGRWVPKRSGGRRRTDESRRSAERAYHAAKRHKVARAVSRLHGSVVDIVASLEDPGRSKSLGAVGGIAPAAGVGTVPNAPFTEAIEWLDEVRDVVEGLSAAKPEGPRRAEHTPRP